jgi:hypothetical protein
LGVFDKALDRLAGAIVKAAPQITQYTNEQLNPNPGYGNSVGLPRDPNMANVPFTPGIPLIPGAINPVRPDGRPDPRRYEYQVAQNINITETRLVPFKTLRAAADQIDIFRRCIEVIKRKTAGLEWDIVLGNDAVEAVMAESGEKNRVRAMAMAQEKFNDEINRARKFWEMPDRSNGLVFTDWLTMAMEEVLVLDAWAVWPQRSVKGDLIGLQILDGSTIKPLIDDRGMRPMAPHPAFQQVLYGFPRSEFGAPDESVEADGEFSSDELAYMVRNRRTFTTYGYGPVEMSLILGDIYLRRQDWVRKEYTDGVLPDLMFETDANFGNNVDLLRAYENVFNDDLAGQTEQRKRARLLPSGVKPVQFEGYGERFKDTLDEHLVTSICGHFGVQPTEIGFTGKTGLGGASVHQGQAETSEVAGQVPFQNWLATQLTNLSYIFLGMPRELEFRLMPSKRGDDLAAAQASDIEAKNGSTSLNERRSAKGLSLIDAPEADQPLIVLPSGSFFITDEGLVPVQPADNTGAATPMTSPEAATTEAEPIAPAGAEPIPTETSVEAEEEPVNKAARDEAKAFIRWLRKSPTRNFEFRHLPDTYAQTLNKFVDVEDYDGARWYAERYLG